MESNDTDEINTCDPPLLEIAHPSPKGPMSLEPSDLNKFVKESHDCPPMYGLPSTQRTDVATCGSNASEIDADDDFPKHTILGPGRPRKRLGLPLIVFSDTLEESIIACPDSGSDNNIMSRRIVDQLNLPITEVQEAALSTFVLANGQTVTPIGQVHLRCSFKQGSPAPSILDCVFYVFQTLAVPMIMGFEFLDATETLTKHRDRLVEELVPSMQSLRVCTVGRPKRNVFCRIGDHVGCATADTGSDLDLISPDFATSRSFTVEESCVELEFADGSTGYTIGVIKTAFSIGRVIEEQCFVRRSKEMSIELFILENLNADIIVGVDTIQDLQAFSGHDDCFIPAMPCLRQSDLNVIRYIGAVERGLSRALGRLKDSFPRSKKKQAAAIDQDRERKRLLDDEQLLSDQLDYRSRLRPRETIQRRDHSSNDLSGRTMDDHFGREAFPTPSIFNEPLISYCLPTNGESSSMTMADPWDTSPGYSGYSPVDQSPALDWINNPFQGLDFEICGIYGEQSLVGLDCPQPAHFDQHEWEFEGCVAPPFQTQALLNSHANIHTQAGSYYCTVKDCSRGQGGRPFRWQKDAIRHGLVHHCPR